MNKYELEKTLNLLEMVRDLTFQHIPEIYSRDISPRVLAAIEQVKKDIEKTR